MIAKVHALQDGELPISERAALDAHLHDCEACATLLSELRRMREQIASAPLAAMSPAAMARLQESWDPAWHAVKDRGVMRIAGWLTAVAASVLIGSLLLWNHAGDDRRIASSTVWQSAAVMPPVETAQRDDSSAELVVVAQWMANDLSGEQGR